MTKETVLSNARIILDNEKEALNCFTRSGFTLSLFHRFPRLPPT